MKKTIASVILAISLTAPLSLPVYAHTPVNGSMGEHSHGDVYTSGSTYTVTGTTHYLALRSDPSYDAHNEIGQLFNGQTVEVISKDGTYWYVNAPSLGKKGYVNSQYLSGGNSSYNTSSASYTVTGVTHYLALRSAPSYDAHNEIGQLYNGQTVEVISKDGTYWYVNAPSLGKKGYVNSQYLSGGGDSSNSSHTSNSYTVTGTTHYLALRSAPSFDANNEIGKLYNGDTVTYTYTADSGTYWYVYAPSLGKSGYVNYKYLR